MNLISKKSCSVLLASILILTMFLASFGTAALASGTGKWTETEMADGWIMVTNEGGKTLGYTKESGVTIIEDDGFAFKDMNRNGTLDVFEDWRLTPAERAEDLATQMQGMDELKMFMFLSLTSVETPVTLGEAMITDLDNGIRTFSVRASSVADNVSAVNMLQAYAETQPFAIPVDLRGDIGNSLTSQWPRHLGFAAIMDEEVVAEFSRMYSSELRDLGLTTVHHPQMDTATEPRWRRFHETFGENSQLVHDLGTAVTNALQSTYAEDGTDLGWGMDSVNALIKHYPGDAPAEGGRESHVGTGKFNVYPGGQFDLHLYPYEDALTGNLPGETKSTAGVMTSFSIHVDANGNPMGDTYNGVGVATSYDASITAGLLRDTYGWDGIVDTDYSVVHLMPWGMEEVESIPERIMVILEGSTDRINNYNVKENILEGFALYEDTYGTKLADARVHESAVRLFITFMQIGLFENPYLSLEESSANVASEDKVAAGLEAQKKSIVLLKNTAGIIADNTASSDLPTVYVPYVFTAATARAEAFWSCPLDLTIASEYFNVVTDAFVDGEVIVATAEELADVDYALVLINSPANAGINPIGMSPTSTGEGYDNDKGIYIPLSLQYRPYTADSEFVRQTSIAGDMIAADEEDYYGQAAVKTQENRSYFGNTSNVTNESHLDLVLNAAEAVDNVVVMVNTATPFVLAEIEPHVDTILLHFNARDRAICELVAGKFEPNGLLPMQMPLNMDTVEAQYEDVPFDMECYVDSEGNVYDFAFGLNWTEAIHDWRAEKYAP